MSENILVVEYEPRYTDRVKQALAGQPFLPIFAKDGEEAMRALDDAPPRLIVLSSVVPKVSTTELIRAIRGRKPLQETPILLTVSGYNGKSPRQDAQRVGASDILPKPYSEGEFLGKVQQMLGVLDAGATTKLTSSEIFGDLLEEEKPRSRTAAGNQRGTGDVDKMLADTLAGMMPKKREVATPASTAAAQQQARTRATSANADLDKMLEDTLSGVRKAPASARPTVAQNTPIPPPPASDAGRFSTEKMAAFVPDRVPVSQPVFPPAVEPAKIEEEEPVDGVKFGQYVLVEKIATGGMAEVWKARMRGVEGFQKIVAIKKILPHLSDNQDFIEMFVDEAKLAAQLNHNNIIHIYDLGKIQSSYYIAMEYIDGYDLKTILRRGEERTHPMTVELALFIASKLASALDYAHRKKDFEEREMGLVHRDVSPQNVLVSQEGDIKLCDFGIAKAASKASHTQAGALKGKLQYMSPEQAWGRSIDRRSDIFALATVLFEMLTNRKLFTGDNELSILEQVREARVQPPSLQNDEVPPEVDQIVIKALQKDPANRYQTAGEMARDLDAVLYSFKPTPTSADLAIYMHRLSTVEPEPFASEPEIETPAPPARPVVAPQPHAPVADPAAAAPTLITSIAAMAAAPAEPVAAPAPFAHEEPKSGKSPMGLIAAAVIILALLGGGAYYFLVMKKAAPATPQTASATPAPAAAAAVPAAMTTDPAAASTATLVPATTAVTQTAVDASMVDQEVARRIAAERARLEAQTRAQQQDAAPEPTTTRAPAPAPAQVAQAPPPVPAAQPVTPAPAQVQPPATQTAAPAPAPAPVQAAAPRAREGDLVPVGTPGLTPPRMTRRGAVTYPPLARNQRVQGTVITSVLVSETGEVLEVRVLRGVNLPVGLNEAAVQTIRRSGFAPGQKDGVRVRTWLTVPIEFRL